MRINRGENVWYDYKRVNSKVAIEDRENKLKGVKRCKNERGVNQKWQKDMQ